jgi:hypothetical protein
MRSRICVRAAIAIECLLLAAISWRGAPWALTIARAQSLAEVARQEEARRKEIKRPARVYTNKDLASVPPPAAPAPTPPDAANASATKPQPATKDEKARTDGASAETTAPGIPKDQAYWWGRMQGLMLQLDRDRTLADALQSHINALTADFSARDDPAQRSVLGLERQKALDELDRLKKSILSDQKSIADFQEEARRASVPPGWLR